MTKQASKKVVEKRIIKKAKENPHHKGSRRYKAFEKLKSGTKVSEAKINTADLAFMKKQGYIEIRSSK